jgi:hypothetical protein
MHATLTKRTESALTYVSQIRIEILTGLRIRTNKYKVRIVDVNSFMPLREDIHTGCLVTVYDQNQITEEQTITGSGRHPGNITSHNTCNRARILELTTGADLLRLLLNGLFDLGDLFLSSLFLLVGEEIRENINHRLAVLTDLLYSSLFHEIMNILTGCPAVKIGIY